MNPSEIRRLIRNAKTALQSSSNAPDGFLLAYVAWEAFQTRVLLVGLAARGLSVSEAQRELKRLQVWRQENKDRLFEELYGARPSNLKVVGKFFSAAIKSKALRDKYVHGASRTGPEQFSKAATELIQIMESDWPSYLKQLLLTMGFETASTNPMGRLRKSTSVAAARRPAA